MPVTVVGDPQAQKKDRDSRGLDYTFWAFP